ncbi:MAG: nucleotidyltransferase [Nitrospirae bacterium CG_4_10_14_3_um_filter_53_41]|nr:MAG: nucleotidyltransferase [Nitrospirae bacterium CG17_big_fil_post_rev_8_21_14_2_50_50_9]PIX86915.1 MAG: nucleotidyltransferase [Nitrospirae bacterium CG_4_10_14_3_um_filter_53_41]
MAETKNKQLIYQSIKRYIEELKKRNIEVVAVYLYGSHAKGKATAWSDIDVAILTEKFIGDSFDFKFLLMKIAREIDPDIEPHPYLVDEFTKDNPLAVEVMRTGEKVA